MIKMMCIGAAALSFCPFFELKASSKEKSLLKVYESIPGCFGQIGTHKHHFVEVTQSGRISLKKGTKAMLNGAELQALQNFLDSGPVRDLQDFYHDFGFSWDCGAHSMEIEMTVRGKTKRIILKWSGPGPPRSKNYPIPLRDLVCKIYGLEERVGIPYGRAVRIEADGHKSFDPDTWCDAASLDLVPNP